MSGLFSSPRPAPAPAPAPTPAPAPAPSVPAPVAAPAPATATAAAASTGSLPEDPVAAAITVMQRRERGLSGTVQTSWRGLLTPDSALPKRKQLLGE